MSNSLLSLLPAGLAVEQVVVNSDHILVAVRARAATASCPLCRRRSRRVHSRYIRHLADLPWQGRIGHFDLQIRRFRCSAPRCPRRIFAERLPEVALPRVRRTLRLAEAQRRIALHAGGEAGARLAGRLAMPVSGDTLLRLIRAAPIPERRPRALSASTTGHGVAADITAPSSSIWRMETDRLICCVTAGPRLSRRG